MLSGENWCWSRLVTRWILKSLTTTETRSRGTQRVIEKKVAINSKTFQVSAQLFDSGSASRLSTSFSSFHHPSRSVGHASRVPLSACVPNSDEWGRDSNQRQTQCSSGSRGGGRGARAGPRLPHIFRPKWGPKGSPPPPRLCDGLDQALQCHMLCECCFPSLLRLIVWVFSGNSGVSLSTKLDMSNFWSLGVAGAG